MSDPRQFDRQSPHRECPICGFKGRFWSFGSPPRADAMCPNCTSLERHRLLQLAFDQRIGKLPSGERVLHFAPEDVIRRWLGKARGYVGVDVANYKVSCACMMESLPFADRSFDLVIANHVLEHVADERRALGEVRRVIDDIGIGILSVPQIHAWRTTYEDDTVTDPELRSLYFGQPDHRRIYGRDFGAKLEDAGFSVDLFQMDRPGETRYGLSRGETLYLVRPNR